MINYARIEIPKHANPTKIKCTSKERDDPGIYSALVFVLAFPMYTLQWFPIGTYIIPFYLKNIYKSSYNHQSPIMLRIIKSHIRILTCIQCNVKLLCIIFTQSTLIESFNITNMLQAFMCSNQPLDPTSSLSNELFEDLRRTPPIRSLPHNHYQGNSDRITFFFSLEFVRTNNNNLNLGSYQKISTKSSRIISFRITSSSTNYRSLVIMIWNQSEVEDV